MLRDGQFIREKAPVIGRAYQRDTRYRNLTDGASRYQSAMLGRRHGRRDESLFEAIAGGLAIVALFLLVVFLPEMMR